MNRNLEEFVSVYCPVCKTEYKEKEQVDVCKICGWEFTYSADVDFPPNLQQRYEQRLRVMRENWGQLQQAKKMLLEAEPLMRNLEQQLNQITRESEEKGKKVNELERNLQSVQKKLLAVEQHGERLQKELDTAKKMSVKRPESPRSARVTLLEDGAASLKWTAVANEQDINYLIVRKTASAPKSPVDGDIVGWVLDTSWIDNSPPQDVQIYYSIFALKSKACSAPAQTSHIIINSQEALPPITGLEVWDRRHYLVLLWEWPLDVAKVWVSWRHDKYPERPSDSIAQSRDITKGEYDSSGGFQIKNPEDKPYWFAVYAYDNIGKKRYGPGVYVTLRTD
ncbi:MAG: hypothetical protein CV087_16110 [Candidatus Brocadia sp. WS118]|nr:MAG: hypothetical protein CV087_16110 [Candidatus Brocadia sp. WS118]